MFLDSVFSFHAVQQSETGGIPASVWKGIKSAGVCAVLQLPPALLINGYGATEAAQSVALAVAGIRGDEAVAGKLLIGVLLAIACGLVDDASRWWVRLGRSRDSGHDSQAAGQDQEDTSEGEHDGNGRTRISITSIRGPRGLYTWYFATGLIPELSSSAHDLTSEVHGAMQDGGGICRWTCRMRLKLRRG